MSLPTSYVLTYEDADAKTIQVEHLHHNFYTVTVAEKSFQVDAAVLPNGALSLLVDEDSYDVDFEGPLTHPSVLVRNHVEHFAIADERQFHLHAIAAGGASSAGKNVVTAPMPGKIVKALVQIGDEVQKGQGLIVVEAMKMENELKSPKKGKVTQIHTIEGSVVEKGAKLITVE